MFAKIPLFVVDKKCGKIIKFVELAVVQLNN